MVVPSLSALFADAAWKMFSDEASLLRSIFGDKLDDHEVFFSGPRACFNLRSHRFVGVPRVSSTLGISAALRGEFF